MASLTPAQVRSYWKQGYVNQIPVLTPDEVRQFRARFDEVEAMQDAQAGGIWRDRNYQPWDRTPHPLEDWFIELATHPRVLDAVESILGPNLLVRNADVFTKEVISEETVSWHRDTAERGPLTDQLCTAWIGLTDSTAQNGAMEFLSGSHREELAHPLTTKESLSLSPKAVQELDQQRIRVNAQSAGHLSIHHFRTIHQSRDNWTDERRIAFVVRYMSPDVTPRVAECGIGLLARGRNTTNHFRIKGSFPVSWDVDSYLIRQRIGDLRDSS